MTQYLTNIKLNEKTIQQYGSSNYGNKFNNHGSGNKKITQNDNEEDN